MQGDLCAAGEKAAGAQMEDVPAEIPPTARFRRPVQINLQPIQKRFGHHHIRTAQTAYGPHGRTPSVSGRIGTAQLGFRQGDRHSHCAHDTRGD